MYMISKAVLVFLSSGQRSLSFMPVSQACVQVPDWCKLITVLEAESRFKWPPASRAVAWPLPELPSYTAAEAALLLRRCALLLPSGRYYPVLSLVSLVAYCPLKTTLNLAPHCWKQGVAGTTQESARVSSSKWTLEV